MEVTVRPAKAGDERRIAEVHVATWRAAYSRHMSKAFLDSLDVNEREKMWLSALSEKGKGSYLVGEVNQCGVGFCVYGPARDDDLGESDSELVAINVLPDEWGNGIGSAMLSQVIAGVMKKNYSSLHLWVIKENYRAIKFYKKYGFMSEGMTKFDSRHSGSPIVEERYVKYLG
jgi:ribosomal protein S18 acetylase RimI-like enzyme